MAQAALAALGGALCPVSLSLAARLSYACQRLNLIAYQPCLADMSTYMNELASDADIARFDLVALCKRYTCSTVQIQWTVDKGRESYLKAMRSNPQDPHTSEFVFYWAGALHELLLRSETVASDAKQRHMRWHWVAGPEAPSTPDGEATHGALVAALKEALTAYRTSGIYSAVSKPLALDFNF